MSTTVVHLNKAPYDVRIDRKTRWGNPFVIGQDGDRAEVIAKYGYWVLYSADDTAEWIREHVHELKGKTLGCWCRPKNCHGDTLALFAESGLEEHYEFNGLECPYYSRFYNLPGHDSTATCAFGCRDEPACVTDQPLGGWPSLESQFRK